MAISQAMCTSFKKELLEAKHNFLLSGGNTFKIALYTSSASLGASTTAYSSTNEISGTNYSAKGNSLTRIDPSSSGTTALTDFADTSWSTATFSARGALIYTDFADSSWSTATFSAMGAMIFNDSASGDPAVVILDFGAEKTATAGTFTIAFPAADASNAIIRIA